MKIHFLLSRPNSKTPTAIKLRFYFKKDFWYGTGILIDPKYWDKENQEPITGTKIPLRDRKADPELSNHLTGIRNTLSNIESQIRNYIEKCRLDKQPFDFEILTQKLDLITSPEIAESEPDATGKERFVLQYVKRFIREIESGARLTPNGKRYARSTVKGQKTFITFWKAFEDSERRKVRFEEVTGGLYRNLMNYCHSQNYRINYTGRRVKELKTYMNAAYNEGLHDNTAYNDFKVHRSKTDEIYLTEKEVQQIQELDLSDTPPMDKARDLFLIGCYTALRFSDIRRIRPEHIIQNNEGQQIEIFTLKTSEKVVIPIRPELSEILEKYDHFAPRLPEQKVNQRIKIIAKQAGITGIVNTHSIIGGRDVYKGTPRNERITTHTARRTAATLMYKAGIPTIEIMKITGHKRESVFLNYIKITKEEAAARMRNNPFFRGNPLKRVK